MIRPPVTSYLKIALRSSSTFVFAVTLSRFSSFEQDLLFFFEDKSQTSKNFRPVNIHTIDNSGRVIFGKIVSIRNVRIINIIFRTFDDINRSRFGFAANTAAVVNSGNYRVFSGLDI